MIEGENEDFIPKNFPLIVKQNPLCVKSFALQAVYKGWNPLFLPDECFPVKDEDFNSNSV